MGSKPRTLTGLVAPFGKPGRTSAGNLQIDARSLTWSAPERVKLLVEHDPNRAIGYATELTHTEQGLQGTFVVDDSAEATAALASAGWVAASPPMAVSWAAVSSGVRVTALG